MRMLAVALVLGGCKPEPPAAPGAGDAAPPGAPAAAAADEPAKKPRQPTGGAGVFGYFRAAKPDTALAKVAAQFTPPVFSTLLTAERLRPVIGAAFGSEAMGEKIDLAAPVGCVVVDPTKFDKPLACVFAYPSGLNGLLADVAPGARVERDAGIVTVQTETKPIFLASAGMHIVVAADPDVLLRGRHFAEARVLDVRANAPDFEGVVFPNVVFTQAADAVREYLDGLDREALKKSGDRDFDQITQLNRSQTRRRFESYGELTQAELWLDIGPAASRIGYRSSAAAGTPSAKEYEIAKEAGAMDPALLRALPAESFFAMGYAFNADRMLDDPLFAPYVEQVKSLDATLGSDLGGWVVRMAEAWKRIAAGPTGTAVFTGPKKRMGLVSAYRTRPGVDAIAVLRSAQTGEAGKKIAGKLAAYVTWSFKRAAGTVAGVRYDVLELRATKKARRLLENRADVKSLRVVLGPQFSLRIAFAQVDDVLYVAVVSQGEKKFLARAIGAARGKKSLGDEPRAAKAIDRQTDVTLAALIDVGAFIRALGSLSTGSFAGKIGAGIDDLLISGRVRDDGTREYTIDVSQSLIDNLRNLSL